MRRIPFIIHRYRLSDNLSSSVMLEEVITIHDVKSGAALEGGRKVVEVEGETVLLDDGEVMNAEAVVYGLAIDFTGAKLDFGTYGGVQTIAAGPDEDGRVLLESGHEIVLFGLSRELNPFPRQKERIRADSHAIVELLEEDRALHIAAGFARP